MRMICVIAIQIKKNNSENFWVELNSLDNQQSTIMWPKEY